MNHHATLWLLNAFHGFLLAIEELYISRGSEFMPLRPVDTYDDQARLVLEGGGSAVVISLDYIYKGIYHGGSMTFFKLIINHTRFHIIQYVQCRLIFVSLSCLGFVFECSAWASCPNSTERTMFW
jgi:hypothetical protein